jgi:hypothetical protein
MSDAQFQEYLGKIAERDPGDFMIIMAKNDLDSIIGVVTSSSRISIYDSLIMPGKKSHYYIWNSNDKYYNELTPGGWFQQLKEQWIDSNLNISVECQITSPSGCWRDKYRKNSRISVIEKEMIVLGHPLDTISDSVYGKTLYTFSGTGELVEERTIGPQLNTVSSYTYSNGRLDSVNHKSKWHQSTVKYEYTESKIAQKSIKTSVLSGSDIRERISITIAYDKNGLPETMVETEESIRYKETDTLMVRFEVYRNGERIN